MIGVAHIVFKYRKNRLDYLKQIIEECQNYPFELNVFIHCDKNFDTNFLSSNYKNGEIKLKKHNIKKYFLYKGWKYRLTFKAREHIGRQVDIYDIFMYLEDDILIPVEAINYWLENKDICLKNNLNLGFLRIEKKDDIEYLSDITNKLDKKINLENDTYVINDKNAYSAFWIYDKSEFNKWRKSNFYDLKIIHGFNDKNSRLLKILRLSSSNYLQYFLYDRRHKRIDSVMEANAYGLAYPGLNWYENTVIKMQNENIDMDCKVYHLPNTYVNESETEMGTLRLDDLLSFS